MKVEVFTTTTLDVSHFAPIIRALRELKVDARFVSPQRTPKSRKIGWDDADRTEALLDSMKLPWGKEPNFDADAVLTIQTEDFIHDYRGKKFRMQYGVGLIPPTQTRTHDHGQPFDYHLVHGPFGQRVQFRYHALASPMLPDDRVKVIGYPRFDDWFSWKDRPTWVTSKPVLLWLPTWGRASSIDRYLEAIVALTDKYDVWVKPHHGTVTWERERMIKLAETPFRIIDFTDPPEPSFAAASIVLADLASGAFGEAVFLKKNVVGLSSVQEVERLLLPDAQHSVPICTTPSDLQIYWIRGERVWSSPKYEGLLRSELVDSTEGVDGMRAAQIICECIG